MENNTENNSTYHQIIFYTEKSELYCTFIRNGRIRHYGKDKFFRNIVFRNYRHSRRIFNLLNDHDAKHYRYPAPWSGIGPDVVYVLPKIEKRLDE